MFRNVWSKYLKFLWRSVKLQAWRLGTPSQKFFREFRQRFHDTNFIAVNARIHCEIFLPDCFIKSSSKGIFIELKYFYEILLLYYLIFAYFCYLQKKWRAWFLLKKNISWPFLNLCNGTGIGFWIGIGNITSPSPQDLEPSNTAWWWLTVGTLPTKSRELLTTWSRVSHGMKNLTSAPLHWPWPLNLARW